MSDRSMLLIDGDCLFCRACADWVERRVRPDADLVPWQSVDPVALGTTAAQCQRAVQWVESGRVTATGAAAVSAMLRTAPAPWASLGRVLDTPPMAQLAESVYRLVADNRGRIPGSWLRASALGRSAS